MDCDQHLQLPPNRFKAGLREGRPQIGLWSALCSNVVAEIIAFAGFDWIALGDVRPLMQTVEAEE